MNILVNWYTKQQRYNCQASEAGVALTSFSKYRIPSTGSFILLCTIYQPHTVLSVAILLLVVLIFLLPTSHIKGFPGLLNFSSPICFHKKITAFSNCAYKMIPMFYFEEEKKKALLEANFYWVQSVSSQKVTMKHRFYVQDLASWERQQHIISVTNGM